MPDGTERGLPLSDTARGLRTFESPELKASVAEVLELIAIADGVIDPDELAVLSELKDALGHPVDVALLEARAAAFRSPEGVAVRAGRAVRDAATSSGRAIRAAASAATASVEALGRGAAPALPTAVPEVPAEPPAAAAVAPQVEAPDVVGDEERRLAAIMGRLQKLVTPHDAGLITDDDAKAQRARILAEL